MVSGEFMAMQRIHAVKPHFVPQPIDWGTYEMCNDVHFLLCEFRQMQNQLPDIEPFARLMAELHQGTTSPDGKFGFDCVTYHGNVPIHHGWHDSWEQYFATTTRALLEKEQAVRGENDTIGNLSKPFFDKVVPRLLRPLETDGTSIKPFLIHGDLWHGNVAVDARSREPIIFDAAGFYAHHECELPATASGHNLLKVSKTSSLSGASRGTRLARPIDGLTASTCHLLSRKTNLNAAGFCTPRGSTYLIQSCTRMRRITVICRCKFWRGKAPLTHGLGSFKAWISWCQGTAASEVDASLGTLSRAFRLLRNVPQASI